MALMSPAKRRDDAVARALWQDFAATKSKAAKDRLVVHYQGLVREVAAKMVSGMPTSVEMDDLVGDGVFGLIDAIGRFEPDRGVRFEAYASIRIKGSIIDGLRAGDWVPRSVRSKLRDLDQAREALSGGGHSPTTEDLAGYLDVSIDDVHDMRADVARAVAPTSLDPMVNEYGMFDPGSDPSDLQINSEVSDVLVESISMLDKRSKAILALYYVEDMTLREIGDVLGVTESRVCQLQSRLLQALGADLMANAS